jgi:hypothetical protein
MSLALETESDPGILFVSAMPLADELLGENRDL